MRAGSLCTGIGGLDLAVQAHFGAEMAWHSEIEKAVLPVIDREWPGVPNLGDIKQIRWDEVPPVDVLTAGYPCQPFSHAGKRKGEDDPRHLWPFIIEGIRTIRPRLVVLENVRGHLTKGFDTVLGSLAEAGFDAEWCLLRASDVGACHQRARLFIVASDTDGGRREGRRSSESSTPRDRRKGRLRGSEGTGASAAPDADQFAAGWNSGTAPRTQGADARRGASIVCDRPPDADRVRRAPVDDSGGWVPSSVEWGQYAVAIRRWEDILGRPAPRPVVDAGRLSPAFVEWMMGYPQGWVDGLTRTQALKALGNAVVPRQALAALRELAPHTALEAAG